MKNKVNFNAIFDELFPICRSITGDGYNRSLAILSRHINFKKIKYPSGKKVFDWVVPKVWKIKEAYIEHKKKRIVDFKKNNLHVISYSKPINTNLSLQKLNKNLFSIKKYPRLIPYVTSYYKKNWGFCMQDKQRRSLKKGNYKVVINSSFHNGHIINGLTKLKGKSRKIILLSSYLCHPSMANNELSGPLVMLGLFEKIKKWNNRRFNYYFLINPETIGSLCFLYDYKNILKRNLDGGLVLTCLGGPKKKLSYKKSKKGSSNLDKIFENLSRNNLVNLRNFDPTEGSDERQYCSSGLDLPVGQIARTVYGDYHQYHTSGDDKNFMKISQIFNSVEKIENILKINEYTFPLTRYIPYGELMLGKRNLYPNINSYKTRNNSSDNLIDDRKRLNILLNLLSYADGKRNILDISNLTNIKLHDMIAVLDTCLKEKMIKVPKQ